MNAASLPTCVLLVCLSSLSLSCGARETGGGTIVLAEGGRTDYRIVVPVDATKDVSRAAEWLRGAIEEISGASVPIAADDAPPSDKEIIVGRRRSLQGGPLADAVRLDGLGEDGFVVRTAGPRIVVAGGGDKGTLRAAAAFLEEAFGCRRLSKDVLLQPKRLRLRQ
mgnify:FL=1